MGKLENKKGCFCRAFPSARTAPAGSDLLRAAFRCHRSHTTAPTSSATSASRYHSTRIGRRETSGRQQRRTGFRAMRAFRTTPLRTKSSRCAEESRKENRRERWLISLAVKSDRLSRQAPDRHEAITTESGLIHCFVACVRQSSHHGRCTSSLVQRLRRRQCSCRRTSHAQICAATHPASGLRNAMDLLATSHRSACELVVVMRIDSLCAKLGFVSCAVLCRGLCCALCRACQCMASKRCQASIT